VEISFAVLPPRQKTH